jgi:hypothetical protein
MSNYSLAVNYVKPDSMLQRSTKDDAWHPAPGVLRCFENGSKPLGVERNDRVRPAGWIDRPCVKWRRWPAYAGRLSRPIAWAIWVSSVRRISSDAIFENVAIAVLPGSGQDFRHPDPVGFIFSQSNFPMNCQRGSLKRGKCFDHMRRAHSAVFNFLDTIGFHRP